MKCHIGADAGSGLVHTIATTSANIHDVTVASELIREDDEVVYGDSGYFGLERRSEVANDGHLSSIDYRINRRPSSLQKVSDLFKTRYRGLKKNENRPYAMFACTNLYALAIAGRTLREA